jgi:hypothetical protein
VTVEQGTNYLAGIDPSAILCERLRARGDEVLCVDNFFTSRRQNIAHLRGNPIFNTYGPRMHPNDGRVESNFIVQALKGEPITLYGTGSRSRSFCYVDDLVSGMIAMMDGLFQVAFRGSSEVTPSRLTRARPAKTPPSGGVCILGPGGTVDAILRMEIHLPGRTYR